MKSIRIKVVTLFVAGLTFSTVMAQEARRITVLVTDSEKSPIPGAAVVVKGGSIGEIADKDGVCILEGVKTGDILTVSCLSYDDTNVKVGTSSRIEVSLKSSNLMLDELVVVGYGVQRRKDLSGAVAQVKGDVINEFASLSVEGALQGRVAGVQINTINGQPGAGVQVRIRGANSIKGDNEPLWIINGFPGDINMINPSDIESVEILKDASATAIYGSRGANGVIIVTTRTAKEGRLSVEYNGSIGVQTLAKQIEMMNGEEYMLYLNEKAEIQDKPAVFTAKEIAENEWNTNWQNEVFRPAIITSHALDVSGGTEKIQSSLGLSWFNQDGIIQKSGYERLSLRADVNYNISKYISIRGNMIFSRSNHDQMNSQGGSRGTSVINATLTTSPLATPHYDDGSWNDFLTQPAAGMNPMAYLNEVKNKWYANRLLANMAITVRPLDGLSIQLSANVNSSQSRSDYFKSKNYPNSKGAAGISFGETIYITSNNIITYDKDFGKHHINVMGGITYEQSATKSTSTGTAENFLSDVVETYDLDAAEIKGLPSSGYSDWKLFSFLGRVNYNYDNRYLLTVNFRADGSSRYSKGNKWGYFPSAAAAWRISQEEFLRDAGWISELKLRVGYGLTGSTAISPYSTQNTLDAINVVFDKDLVVGYAPKDQYLGDLRWETTAQTNVGLDFIVLDNRLSFTADWYYKKTTDLLNDVEMPRSSGYTTALRNIGATSNTGLELQIDSRIIDSQVKWDLGLNFSFNRSKVLSLAEDKDIFGATVNNTIISDQLNLMREGEEMFLFYGYVEDGYDENGQIVYHDFDNDGNITPEDKRIIGNPNPDFLFGFNTSISYKGFTLSAFFQGSYGNDIYSMTAASLGYDYGYNTNALRDVFYNHWTPEKPNAPYPNLLANLDLKMSDRFVYDGSYLRLKNLELSYSFSCEKQNFFKNAIVYVSGQNLVTFTKYPFWDPDVNAHGGGNSLRQGVDSNNYPQAMSFTLGCRLRF